LIKKIIDKYQKKNFLIAYSGGLDSTVLLHQMIKIKNQYSHIKIRAIHINHNLHDYSKKWENHCKKNCVLYKIPFIVENINLDLKNKNVEETLRKKRYHSIFNNLLTDEILLTGHHMNDQCETLMLALKRGSGPNGLSSMLYETTFNKNKKIVRPFLTYSKRELKSWAVNNKIKWIEDFSNLDINYDRNFIRSKVIPVFEKRWPYFLKNCARTSKICHEETILLNSFLKEKIHKIHQIDGSLSIDSFKNITKIMSKALIRYWISLNQIQMPSYKNIEYIYNIIVLSKTDSNSKIILQKKNEIRRYKKRLYFIKIKPSIYHTIIFWHNKDIELYLPNDLGQLMQDKKGITLPSPRKNELINIRFQFEGSILILGREKKRKIKKIWQEKKIPPWLRKNTPLLFYNNQLISALGVFIINDYHARNTWKISWKCKI